MSLLYSSAQLQDSLFLFATGGVIHGIGFGILAVLWFTSTLVTFMNIGKKKNINPFLMVCIRDRTPFDPSQMWDMQQIWTVFGK